ncbi:enoyl-CoA hydratase/isomerase family protein [Bordetella sp. N]|uniref:enoyl-CoA hydratase/isomerase family protein n=1 Tax=Bordetella sp. N TaxID=1746199 RepID=UPI00070B6F15|nr:enoyl-CoA hydratase/isomerase family protein [Bordetella sp. N]ALM84239.1 3-hydroxypropionyl-CoA dehydratase [Bordetella sp. N]
MTEEVNFDCADGIAWITLNRPAKANAMTVAMSRLATDYIAKANAQADVKAIVLGASGEKIFSAGVDVREAAPDGNESSQRERRSLASAALQDAILDSRKPVIAALNGAAIGGGAMLALLADARVAVPSASLSLPEIDIGIATFSGANIVQAIAGRLLAVDLILSGRRMSAEEAQDKGIINTVVEASGLRGAAADLAKQLGDKSSGTFGDIKRWLNRPLKAAIAEAREEHARHRSVVKN